MSGCCHHDLVDWLAALGPTLATVFAGLATISVYRRGERFQRQLVRPLLAVRQAISPNVNGFVRWIVEIRNEGQGPANIDNITVIAGEKIIDPEPMQSPNDYWHGVILTLGILRVHSVEGGQTISPPVSVKGDPLVLFDASVQGETDKISEAIKKLEIRLKYRSSLGEKFSIHSRYGHTESF
jgi:hypothetical protein